MNRREWILLAAGMLCRPVQADDWRRMPHADEAPRDPALESLLDRMRGFVAARDHRGLEALMLPEFRIEFDVGNGPRVFHGYWHPESGDSAVWGILERLLTLGGTSYSQTLYALPYVYALFPSDLDPLAYVVAVKRDAPLRAKPAPDAERVGSLDFSIARLAERLQPPVVILPDQFVELNHPEAGRCFAAASDVYSPAAHRAFFERRKGAWRWISLAAATLDDPPVLNRSNQRN
jgi:hypothetical protein